MPRTIKQHQVTKLLEYPFGQYFLDRYNLATIQIVRCHEEFLDAGRRVRYVQDTKDYWITVLRETYKAIKEITNDVPTPD